MTDDRLPWFQCYPSKLLGALAGMTPDQQLVYVIVLLRIYEVRGPCPDPLDAIARRIGINKRRASEALDVLFRTGKLMRVGDAIMNPYAERILSSGDEKHEKRVRAGAEGGKAAAEKRKEKQMPPTSNPTLFGDQEDLEKERKNVVANAPTPAVPAAPLDVRTRLFREGLETLARISGRPPNPLRALLGKWLKACNDDALAVLRSIEDAEQNRVIDPIPWIERAIAMRRGAVAETRNGMASLLVRMAKGRNDVADEGLEPVRALPAR